MLPSVQRPRRYTVPSCEVSWHAKTCESGRELDSWRSPCTCIGGGRLPEPLGTRHDSVTFATGPDLAHFVWRSDGDRLQALAHESLVADQRILSFKAEGVSGERPGSLQPWRLLDLQLGLAHNSAKKHRSPCPSPPFKRSSCLVSFVCQEVDQVLTHSIGRVDLQEGRLAPLRGSGKAAWRPSVSRLDGEHLTPRTPVLKHLIQKDTLRQRLPAGAWDPDELEDPLGGALQQDPNRLHSSKRHKVGEVKSEASTSLDNALLRSDHLWGCRILPHHSARSLRSSWPEPVLDLLRQGLLTRADADRT